MTQQYIRQCRLTVAGGFGTLDLSQMRIRFHVTHPEVPGQPQAAQIIVTNLSDATEQKIMGQGGSVNSGKQLQVTLEAGYAGNYGQIFQGDIIQAIRGRESPTDTTFTIVARNSHFGYSFGVVNTSLAAGHTWRDRIDACLKALAPFGVTAGYIADLGSKKFPRGRVLTGMVKDQMRELTKATDTTWHIIDGKLNVTKNGGWLPGDAIVLNSTTGLIGRPNQTFTGIEVRCLLNPRIRPETRLKIDESSINKAIYGTDVGSAKTNNMIPSLAMDGIYKVMVVDETGDTRDTPWYTDSICIAASGPIPVQIGSKYIPNQDVVAQEEQSR